jgi:hypothetical protein
VSKKSTPGAACTLSDLLTRRVPGRRYEQQGAVAEHVVFTIDDAIVERIVQVGWVVWALRCTGHVHLGTLDDERCTREECVAAAMIEVEVRVDDVRGLGSGQAHRAQLVGGVLVRRRAQRERAGNAFPRRAIGSCCARQSMPVSKSTTPR